MVDSAKTIIMDTGAIIAALAGFTAIVLVAYRKVTAEIRNHSVVNAQAIESAVKRLNGWLDSVLDALPYPAWIKVATRKPDGSVEFRMQFVNRAYEHWYDMKRENYIGRTDFDVWPRETANAYYAHDAAVLSSKKGSVFSEPFHGGEGVPDGVMEFEKQYIRKGDVEGIIGFVRPIPEGRGEWASPPVLESEPDDMDVEGGG